MKNIQISEKQKTIIIVIGVVILVFYLFISFVYNPEKKHLIQMKKEYAAAQSQVEEFKRLVGEGKSAEEVVEVFKKKVETFDNKFPQKEEVILREISGAAERLGVEISSIRPDKKKAILSINNAPINISGCVIQEMLISMNIKASYKKLGEFLRTLREDLPVFVSVEDLSIGKPGDNKSPILDITLTLKAYPIFKS